MTRKHAIHGAAAILAGFVLAASLSQPSSAQEAVALRGQLHIAGKTPVDPPPDEPKNTHAYLLVTGPAALRMYRRMRAKEAPNPCEEGKKFKQAGPLLCTITANEREATCDFSVDLVKGTLDGGRAC